MQSRAKVIIDPVCLDGTASTNSELLSTILLDQSLMPEGDDVIEMSHPYEVTILNPQDHSQQTIQVSLEKSLIKPWVEQNRGLSTYWVLSSDEPSEITQNIYAGFRPIEILGTIESQDGQPFQFRARESAYLIGGAIDFTMLTDRKQQYACARLLRDIHIAKGVIEFPAGPQNYELIEQDGASYIELNLAHPIICYQKEGGGIGFEAVGNQVAEGGFSQVYAELKRLVMRSNGQVEMMNPKHVIKKSYVQKGISIWREWEMAKDTPYLHAKKPIVLPRDKSGQQRIINIERCMPGVVLAELIDKEITRCDKGKSPKFTTSKRLTLSIEMLYAMQEQLHSVGIIHRDVKPDNMMVHHRTRKTKYIDLNVAKRIEKKESSERTGSPAYMPLEAFNDQYRDARTDVYSVAVCIAEFWGMFRDFETLDDAIKYASAPTLPMMFSIDDNSRTPLGNNEREQLKVLLARMLAASQSNRCALLDAIAEFEEIRLRYYLSQTPNELHDGIRGAYNLAIALRLRLSIELQAQKDVGEVVTSEKIKEIMGVVSAELTQLSDTRVILDIFVDALGVVAFQGVITKDEFAAKIADIISSYDNEVSELVNFEKLAQTYLDDDCTELQQAIAEEITSTVSYLQKKCSKVRLSVDSIVDLTKRLAAKRESLLVPLQAELSAVTNESRRVNRL